MRAVLYARVSTEEQGNKGYSLRQQLEALRSYCKDHNIEIIAEFEDRASGASLDRPGLDALRDVVSSGGIDLVLCQDRDRLSREPAHVFLLREEFFGHGTTLRSLNDRGDDSPEGQLHDGILDQLAKFERAKTMERTRRGRVRKAQEGKVVGNGSAPYGFYYRDDQYHVDHSRMCHVREMFQRAAAGDSLYSIIEYLNQIGAPTPKGVRWHASTLRQILQSDTYTGVFYWAKNKYTTTTISRVVNGERVYKKKSITETRPKSDWIAIPVPDSGIPPETIARARESLKGNVRSVSKNGGKTWELSGGVGICSECGRHMVAHTSRNTAKRTYYYYRCSSRKHHECSNRKNYPAQGLEMQVKDEIVNTFHPETWVDFVNDLCDRAILDLRKLHRSPHTSKERLVKRIGALEAKLDRARNLHIDGDLPRPAYEEKKAAIQGEIEVIQEELTRVDDLDEEIMHVEDVRYTLLQLENPLSGHYSLINLPSDRDIVVSEEGFYGDKETAARRRQIFYRRVGMQVKVGEELEITLGLREPLVSRLNTDSGVTAAPAPVGAPGSLSHPLS